MRRNAAIPRNSAVEDTKDQTKPSNDQLMQMHLASIVGSEIWDALPPKWKLTRFTFHPSMLMPRNGLFAYRKHSEAVYSLANRFSFESIEAPYSFPNTLNFADMVKSINSTLRRVPHAKLIDSAKVLEKYFNDLVIVSPLKPKKNAVYITGADPLLGAWKTAYRLSYHIEKNKWKFFTPHGVKMREITFLEGDPELGKEVNVALLQRENHPLRFLPIDEVTEKPKAERGLSK